MNWLLLSFEQLSTWQLYDCLRLRTDVFIVEQTCPYPELDGRDKHPETYHLLGYRDDKLTAYARLLPAGLTYDDPSIGRVVTAQSERGNGCGHELLRQALQHMHELWPNQAITIGAQARLVSFYQQHGFETISAEYLEDGIAHIDMTRPANILSKQA